MRAIFSIVAGAILLAGTPASAGSRADIQARGEAKLAKALEGRVAGKPVNCINQRSITSSTIYDRTAIVYRVGSRLYLNRPVGGAESLDRDDILVTRTSSSQLCDIDVVRLVDRTSRFPNGFVSLGKFVPYTKAERTN